MNAAGKVKLAFLDRDGTVNVDFGYVDCASDIVLIEGAAEALGQLQDAGFLLAIVTNQSAIASGRLTLPGLAAIHNRLKSQLRNYGVNISAIAFCPHSKIEQCECRKPRTGMASQIVEQLGGSVDFAASWMFGDKPSDIEFGQRLGTRTALIKSRYWNATSLTVKPEITADSLLGAVEVILAGGRDPPGKGPA